MDWEKIKYFHMVATAGSFTAAAKELHLSQSALSRHIKHLEDDLNLSLFTRHARGIVLTHEGEQLYNAATDMRQALGIAETALLERRTKPFGPLRITTTVSFGSQWLSPRLKKFYDQYPDIQLRLILSDNFVDLSVGEADVAIRFGNADHADVIQRHLGTVTHHIYASPQYISRRGAPEKAEDLDHHDIIVYGPSVAPSIKNINWIMEAGRAGYDRKPVLEVNSLFGVLQAVKSGFGLAAIPDYLAKSAPELVQILPEINGPAFETYIAYPSEMKRSKRVRAFTDFLLNEMHESSSVTRPRP